jgi:hypothetical protein
MGGPGSGRPGYGGRTTVDECRSLDVNRLNREGCLSPGWAGCWQWTRDGEQTASIRMQAEANHLVLSYRWRAGDGDWKDVEEPVAIFRVPCRFGGSRPYFQCPGVINGNPCRRHVTKLYGDGRYFLCRNCYGLAYASQSESAWDRALRRTNRIRMRLGGDPDMAAQFPERPKGMWRRTYERLRDEAFNAEMLADEAFAIRTASLLSRIDDSKSKKEFWR